LVVWGEEDRLVPVELARSWVELLARGTLATFPDAGHLVLDESPEASAAVARFCATSD
jgi:pimeloyl-ACP methyl ester carboxylesterase